MKLLSSRTLALLSPIALVLVLLLLIPEAAPVVLAQSIQPEEWVELVEERTRVGKTYLNLTSGHRSITTGLTSIHYESVLDSGVYDAEVDFNPRRIDNVQLDGWTVTQNGWHYALGQPGDKSTDGWVGFGGQQGDNWVKFRLSRVGYLYGPTRAWEDLGGAPTYDRAQLSSTTSETDYGHGNMVTVQTTATWANLWNTPGGGSLNVSWQASGAGLKEDIIINQAAREWLAANRPPSTPAADTWFGFVLQVDWSDIPKALLGGLEIDLTSDFVDTGTIELRDALDRLLAFMPLSEARVPTGDPLNPFDVRPVQKRFWLDGDGNHYVLMGIRLPDLVGMAAGDLIFDPTVDEQVGAGADDGFSRDVGEGFDSSAAFYRIGKDQASGVVDGWARFSSVAIPQGASIDVAHITVQRNTADGDNDGPDTFSNIYFSDEDDPASPTNQTEHAADPRTTAFTAWDEAELVADTDNDSPSIVSVIQEITDRPGWVSGQAMLCLWDDDGSGLSDRYSPWSYDGDTSRAMKLHIEWSTPWTNTAPTITNKLTADRGEAFVAYSRSFLATDPDTNQTLNWTLETDATFLSVDALNRTVFLNGTPASVGVFFVNLTVNDTATVGAAEDFVNYTLQIREEGVLTDTQTMIIWLSTILMLVLFVVGPVFRMFFLWMLAGIDGILFGLFVFSALANFPLAIIIMGFGGFLLVGGILLTISQAVRGAIAGREV